MSPETVLRRYRAGEIPGYRLAALEFEGMTDEVAGSPHDSRSGTGTRSCPRFVRRARQASGTGTCPHTTASSPGSTGSGLPRFEATRPTVDQSMLTGTQSVAYTGVPFAVNCQTIPTARGGLFGGPAAKVVYALPFPAPFVGKVAVGTVANGEPAQVWSP